MGGISGWPAALHGAEFTGAEGHIGEKLQPHRRPSDPPLILA